MGLSNVEQYFDSIAPDLAEGLAFYYGDLINHRHDIIRLYLNLERQEYTLLSFSNTDQGLHSSEFGKVLTKDCSTHISLIRGFYLTDFKQNWQAEKIQELRDRLQER